jgi:hypothetical protein
VQWGNLEGDLNRTATMLDLGWLYLGAKWVVAGGDRSPHDGSFGINR